MNPQNFNRILSADVEPDLLRTRELSAIVEEFPYFQAARALQLKGLFQHGSFLYNAALKQTAAHTADRSVLFEYITSEEFRQHHISQRIKTRRKQEEQDEVEEMMLMEKEEADKVLDPDLFEENLDKTEEIEEKVLKQDPVDFDKNKERSFSEWLKLTRAKPIDRNETIEQTKADSEQDVIERFIQNDPKIKPAKTFKSTFSLEDYEPESPLMTETLAKIYEEQKNYSKAIQAYKILILKNPEKSSLFANRIQEIENLIENRNK